MSLKSVNQLYNVMLVKPTPVCVLFVSNKSCLLFLTFHQSQFRPWKCSHWGGNGGFFSSCDFSRVTVNVSCMLRKISHPTLFVRRTVHEEGIIRSWNIRRHQGLFSCQLFCHVVFTEYWQWAHDCFRKRCDYIFKCVFAQAFSQNDYKQLNGKITHPYDWEWSFRLLVPWTLSLQRYLEQKL